MELKIDEVYTFKLNSSEEVVARVKEYTEQWISISEPVTVAPGQHGMGLIPSVFTANPKEFYRLNTSSVAIYAITDESVTRKYLEATTGLVVPDKKMILG